MTTRENRPPLALLRGLAALLIRGPQARDIRHDLEEHMARDIQRGMSRGRAILRYAHNLLGSALAVWRARLRRPRTPDGSSLGVKARTRRLDVTGDLRHAARLLLRQPGFTLVVCLTLALGIGANAAIFSVLDAALFRPLPYRAADRLVAVHMLIPAVLGEGILTTTADGRYADNMRLIPQVFDGVAALSDSSRDSADPFDEPLQVGGLAPGLPEFLGISPRLGRAFTDEDLPAGGVVVISDDYWNRAFNRDPDVLGRPLRLSDGVHTIIGVMPPTFRYFVGSDTEAWRPVAENEADRVVARLRAGLTVKRAQEELDAFLADPEITWDREGLRVLPAEWNRGEDTARVMLFVLLGAVGVLLLIACANVANLLLARTFTRRREIAVRGALGATPGRLARQFLTEGLVTAGFGGVAAIAVAWLGIRLVPAIVPQDLASTILGVSPPRLDLRVLLAGLGATLASGCLCAVVPALTASRAGGSGWLAAGRRVTGRAGRHRRAAGALQTVQVALTMVLLFAAGLLMEAFVRVSARPAGFDADGLAYVRLAYPRGTYEQGRKTFNDELAVRMAGLPGVHGVTPAPLPTAGGLGGRIRPEGSTGGVGQSEVVEYFPVRPGYFEITGIPILEGRRFLPEDVTDEPAIAIVSADVAARFWPGQSVIGKRFIKHDDAEPLTIVGVAGPVKTREVAHRNAPVVYEVSARQFEGFGVLFRITGDPGPVFASVVELVQAMDGEVAVGRVALVEELYAESDPLGSSRFYAVLMGMLAALGLLTAAVGLFGLLSYSVSRRVHELGVRMALGASALRLRGTVIAQALVPVAAGLAIGLVLAAWLSRFVAAQHPHVTPNDPLTLVVAVVVFGAVAAVAAFGPARRATRVDPAIVLKGL